MAADFADHRIAARRVEQLGAGALYLFDICLGANRIVTRDEIADRGDVAPRASRKGQFCQLR